MKFKVEVDKIRELNKLKSLYIQHLDFKTLIQFAQSYQYVSDIEKDLKTLYCMVAFLKEVEIELKSAEKLLNRANGIPDTDTIPDNIPAVVSDPSIVILHREDDK